MRVHIYLSLAGAICLSAANPVPAVSGVDESPISLFKRDPTACEPTQCAPETDDIAMEVFESYGAIRLLKCGPDGEPLTDQGLTKRMRPKFPAQWLIPMTKPAVVAFRAWFSGSQTALARRPYERKWGGVTYEYMSAPYKSGPVLSKESTKIKSFVPGGSITDGRLCMVTSNMLTEPLRKCVETEHPVELFLAGDFLVVLAQKFPGHATEIIKGPLQMWTQYPKIGGKKATAQYVIDAVMLNSGSTTDGMEDMSVLDRDVNKAKGLMFLGKVWPGDTLWNAAGTAANADLLFKRTRDIAYVMQYMQSDITKAKVQTIVTKILSTFKTYQELTALAGCPDVAQLYLDFIRDRFKTYSDHSIKVYKADLVRWEAKKWDGSCEEIEAMTAALKAAEPKGLDIDTYIPKDLIDKACAIPQPS